MATFDSLTVPPFQSKLAPELLEGLDKRGQYLYTKIDEIGQAQSWLVEKAVENSHELKSLKDELILVKEQTTKTNGRTSANEKTIGEIKQEIKQARPVLTVSRYALVAAKSKYFWIGGIAFFTVVVPWLMSHKETVFTFLKIWLGV